MTVGDAVAKGDAGAAKAAILSLVESGSREGLGALPGLLEGQKPEFVVAALHPCIAQLKAKILTLEEEFSRLSEVCASALSAVGRFQDAADVLADIQINSAQRTVSDEEKSRVCTAAAKNLLEVSNWVEAEKWLNRAAGLQKQADVNLSYKICFALVQDFKGRYLDAARHFHAITQMDVSGDVKAKFMERALIACVLAEAGPQRSRVLNMLYKDDGASKLELFGFLENVYFDKILRVETVETFSKHVLAQHKQPDAEGRSPVDKAIAQHNIRAASRIYRNISFTQLGAILGVSAASAEDVVAKMIMDGRLSASIDQLEGIVSFTDESASLKLWDEQVKAACRGVDRVVDMIAASH